eukprot:TRINITY_DN1518_c0_g1_i1.p1 TRINITY_DN1518_c0_g1~~TRINITY_DN1518_c0_g1_i1.p1  ORF type:complete len:402 (+),score=135.94 TRINITY_DN1518_c0_g1_i1:53-1258(+)
MADNTAEIIKITEDGGITKKIITPGTGTEKPTKSSKVSVHYVGTLLDGTVFDSSRKRNDPFKFELGVGQVIKGWDQGVATMLKGEKAVLTCKPEYAYGASGSPPTIPPNSTLQFEVELLSWNDSTDVSTNKDGGIMKKVLVAGEGWERADDDSKVTINIKGKIHKEDEVFHSSESTTVIIGEEQLPEGVETAIKSMQKGEKARFVILPKYAYGDKGDQAKKIPANATLEYEIELLDLEKEKESWDMSSDEKISAALKRKTEGNTLFTAQKYARAFKKYKKALTYLDADHDLSADEKEKARQQKLPLHLNMAACRLEEKNYRDCIEHTVKALAIDHKSVKALLRSGKAKVGLAEYDAADSDFKKILEFDTNNQEAISERAKLAKKRATQDAQDKKLYSKMFK